MTQQPLDLDGFCMGPLFAPPDHRRPLLRPKGKEGIVHRAQTVRATPAWADMAAIKAFYREAKTRTRVTNRLHVVDHIVPKISPYVCGLHVPANLQVIDWLANARKGNFWWPDMWAPQGELF